MSESNEVIARGHVAVITGGASGIGRALADRVAAAGMSIVLADVDETKLRSAEAELSEAGADVTATFCDTAVESSVVGAVELAVSRFGGVHLMCNNAGIAGTGDAWRGPVDLWRRVIDINLMGVVHGIRAVLPIMEDQGIGHIVNTASMAGLVVVPGAAPYNVTKHGVVALSEGLFVELGSTGSPVGVSVLCPSFVRTSLMEREPAASPADGVAGLMTDFLRAGVESGMPVAEVAEQVVAAVTARRFWILTHPETRQQPVERMRRAADLVNPPLFGEN